LRLVLCSADHPGSCAQQAAVAYYAANEAYADNVNGLLVCLILVLHPADHLGSCAQKNAVHGFLVCLRPVLHSADTLVLVLKRMLLKLLLMLKMLIKLIILERQLFIFNMHLPHCFLPLLAPCPLHSKCSL